MLMPIDLSNLLQRRFTGLAPGASRLMNSAPRVRARFPGPWFGFVAAHSHLCRRCANQSKLVAVKA